MGGIPNSSVGWVEWLASGLRQECPKCDRSGQIRTYVTDAGIRIWEHADGGICSEPNHLQYWARELDRPIETRSIEEQQRARERGPMEVPMVSTASTASMAQSQLARGNEVWDAIVRHTTPPAEQMFGGAVPKSKKLPIVKPTKRKFNFKDG